MVVNRQFSDFLGWVQRGAPPSNILHPSEGFPTPHRENIQPTSKEEISGRAHLGALPLKELVYFFLAACVEVSKCINKCVRHVII